MLAVRSMIMAPSLTPCLLAQAEDSASAIFWTFIVLVIVLAGSAVVWWVRRKLSPDEDFHGEGFTLGDLRRLRKAGQMTEDEYERAKEVILAGMGVPPPRHEEPQIKPDTLPGER